MAHDVFISYVKADKGVAERICAALEENGVSCWIAPRDATPGGDYQVQIVRAISACRLLVLVYSSEIDQSPFVPRELERAVSKNIRILPFKITTAQPSEKIELFLAMSHWLDATEGPLDRHIQRLIETVAELLQKPLSPGQVRGLPQQSSRRIPRWALVLGGVGMALLLGFLGMRSSLFRSTVSSPPSPAQIDSKTPGNVAISIQTSPEAVAIVLDGTPSGTTPLGGLLVSPGEHRIQLSKPGYSPLDTNLIVAEKGPFEFTYSLHGAPAARTSTNPAAATGTVSVTSIPRAATVWMDGRQIGMTPLSADKIEIGTHRIEVVLEGYDRFTREVVVSADRAATVNAVLTLSRGALRVTSTPDGATVLLNGERKGTTPCTLESLAAGRYQLVLEKGGSGSFSGTATVAPNTLSSVHGELKTTTRTLSVRVIPSGIIYVDADRKTADSNAPYSIQLVPGKYEVTAVSLTWGRWIKSVNLDGSEDKEIVFDFSREFRVTITSDPANAKIYVNDVFTGKYTPSILSLRPGQRKIEVRKEGFELRGKPVEMTLESSLEEPIHFVLSRNPGQ